jgi:RNA recognition motif. (a.k.a. RRM, RBD, or RNP domain)
MITVGYKRISSLSSRSGNLNLFSREFALHLHTTREADPIERILGGTRYEFVPIPESMKSTTIFVGNICEFAHDDDLSALFQKVSKLHSVPACIARKVDTSSLQYGFVSFPSVEEKEVGIVMSTRTK